jgi:hypothetical protein
MSTHRRTDFEERVETCSRCGQALTAAERLLGEMMPPAVCAGCANRELGDLETQINLLAPWKRRIVWTSMVQRAAGKVATRRSA